MKKPLSRSVPGLIVTLLVASQLSAQDKPKYMLPSAEFFRPRVAPSTVIQPGDVIAVTSYSSAELTRTVRVRDDGKVSLPLLQGVQAGGLTPEQLQQSLTASYAREFTHPDLTVDLIAPSNNQVYVAGEVDNGGPKELRGHLTVAQALASSKVMNKSAKLGSTFLLRAAEPGHYLVYKLDASLPVGSGGNVELAPGDVLFVPKKFIAKADEFVDTWIRQLLPATPTSNLSVLFTPGQATTLATTATR